MIEAAPRDVRDVLPLLTEAKSLLLQMALDADGCFV